MKAVLQQQQQEEMFSDDLHAGGGNEGNNSGFDGVVEEREIWLDNSQQDDELLDINDASIFYADFPPLPDFPCMSSSSSSSSTQAPVKAIACSSSASTASSSSSAASWAGLKSDADEDTERKNNGHPHQQQQQHHGQHDPAALSSTASMEISQTADQNVMDGVDCMDVMETFGYMDPLDNNDFFDPSSIFHHDDTGLEEFQQYHQQQQQQQEHESTQQKLEQGGGGVMRSKNQEGQTQEYKASDDLATVFLEWLKTNKETVSAEDLRRVKIKKATIECAARRLGCGKEAMKQLLKLILEWVQNNHLQKRRFKESTDNLPYQYSNPNSNPNQILNCNSILPSEPNSYFSQPAWIPQPAYAIDSAAAAAPPLPGFAPVVGYMGDPFANGAPNFSSHHHPYHPPTDYQMLESAQSLPHPQFALASQYNSFPDSNLHQAPLQQPSVFPCVNQFTHQYASGHNNDQRLVRLGSSATRRRGRRGWLGREAQANPGNWVYWPSVGGVLASNPPLLPGDAAMVHAVERSAMQGQTYQQRQVAPDRRQVGMETGEEFAVSSAKVLKQAIRGRFNPSGLDGDPRPKEAETHLPELEARDGISIEMEDIGTSRVWNMRYRFWPNNKSRMYLLENTGDFVRTNGLQEGDFIVIFRCKMWQILIRGVKVRQPGTKSEAKRQGKSQKNQQTNYPASAAIIAASSTPITQTVSTNPTLRTLIGYSDSDWGTNSDDRRSTTRHFMFLGGNLIAWSSKKQEVVSRSSIEAEFEPAVVGFDVRSSGRGCGRTVKVDKSNLLSAATAFDSVAGLSNNNTTSTPLSAFTADQWKALANVFGNMTISNDRLNGRFNERLWIIDIGASNHDLTRKLIGMGSKQDGLYYFNKETSSIQAITVDRETSSLALWHSKMGNPSEKIVKLLPPIRNYRGSMNNACEVCFRANTLEIAPSDTFDKNVEVDLDFVNFLDDEVQPHNPVDVASPSSSEPIATTSFQVKSTTSADQPLVVTSETTSNPTLVVNAPDEVLGCGLRQKTPSVLRDYVTNIIVEETSSATSSPQLPSEHEPRSFKEAIKDESWRSAMQNEIKALEENERLKDRLVVFGNHQIKGLDYNEIFVPVAKMVTIRVFLAIAASKNWELHQMDVHNVFLHDDLDEE
ncbi:ABI3, putative isoform 4 [Hibiscus syriacus]|uniref:ABI3, putative isoform 4 n=1 Tax=Hibiscus syriacus TaxID=106335 RepID=A0A6A2Y2R1_HIBSY|nr:ABI3, putative isoform 4 [Hibiscus syriacus]